MGRLRGDEECPTRGADHCMLCLCGAGERCATYCTRSALKSSGWMRVCVRLLYRCASIRTEPHRAAPSPHTNGLRTIPCPISGRRV